jgi:hypothetical protein
MTRARIAIGATDETAGAFQAVRGRLQQLSGQAQALTGSFSAVASGLAAVLGGVSLTAYFKQVVDGIDRLNDLKDATGASIGNLSALEDVAARTGTSFETVQAALVKFNQALAGAKPGSAAAEVFRRLGLSLADLRDQDPAEALRQTAVALARFPDDGNKARASMELFGRSLGQVAPLLADLAKSGELNATVTEKQAAEAEAFNIKLAQFAKNATDAGRAVAGALLPSMNSLLEVLNQAARNPGGFFAGLAKQADLGALRGQIDGLRTAAERMEPAVARARATLAGGQGSFLAQDSARQTIRNYERLQSAAADYLAQLEKITLADKKGRPANEGGGRLRQTESLGFIDDAALARQRQQAAAVQQYGQQLRDQILATQQLSEEEKARIAINRGLLGVLDASTKAQVLGLASALDSIRAQQSSARAFEALQQEGLAVTRSLQTEQERLAEQVARADVLVAAGAITWGTYGRAAVEGLQRLTKEVNSIQLPRLEALAEPLRQVSEFASQAARNIRDALGDSVLQVIKGNADDIGQIWQDLLQRMVAQALAAKLGEALFGNYGKTGEFGGLLGFLGSSVFGGARANGGPVSAGRAYLVGERGPEIVMPASAGTVVPNHALGGMAVTVNVAAGVTRGEVTNAVQLGMQHVESTIMQRLRAARVL